MGGKKRSSHGDIIVNGDEGKKKYRAQTGTRMAGKQQCSLRRTEKRKNQKSKDVPEPSQSLIA